MIWGLLRLFCCCCTTWNSTKPSAKFTENFNMPGVYVRSVRMPHLHLPTCNSNTYTTQSADPQYKSNGNSTKSTVGRCTLHSQYLSWSECHATGWWQLLPARHCEVSRNTRCVYQCLPMAAMAKQAMPLRIAWTRVLHSPWQSIPQIF